MKKGDMNFALIFKFLIDNFQREKIDCALMGGLALQASGVTRTTSDIDLMVLSESSPRIKDMMLSHGYRLIHESGDIMNFVSDNFELGRVDFLLAHRKYTLAMLGRAKKEPVLGGKFMIKVLSPDDQIGLKVQSSSNDAKRMHQDMADIKLLMEHHHPHLDMGLVREYFSLFGREHELDDLIREIKDVK